MVVEFGPLVAEELLQLDPVKPVIEPVIPLLVLVRLPVDLLEAGTYESTAAVRYISYSPDILCIDVLASGVGKPSIPTLRGFNLSVVKISLM